MPKIERIAAGTTPTSSPARKKMRPSEEDEEEGEERTTEVVENGEKRVEIERFPSKDEEDKKQAAFGFEHLEHPADIQLHAWGASMEQAMEQLVVSMYSYLIDDMELSSVEEIYEYYFEATGSDLESLVFKLLDEALVAFQSEPFFLGKRVVVDSLDLTKFSVAFHAHGESYDIDKHKQGTDVKAITYSNMQIVQGGEGGRCDLYVIIDI